MDHFAFGYTLFLPLSQFLSGSDEKECCESCRVCAGALMWIARMSLFRCRKDTEKCKTSHGTQQVAFFFQKPISNMVESSRGDPHGHSTCMAHALTQYLRCGGSCWRIIYFTVTVTAFALGIGRTVRVARTPRLRAAGMCQHHTLWLRLWSTASQYQGIKLVTSKDHLSVLLLPPPTEHC